jgi:hypothetical protein
VDCPACQSLVESMAIPETTMRQSLGLSQAELRYLERAHLANQVRARLANYRSRDAWTLTVAALVLLGGAIAWLIFYPAFELLVGVATRAGISMIAIDVILQITTVLIAGVASFATSPVADLMPAIAAIVAIAMWIHMTSTARPFLTMTR